MATFNGVNYAKTQTDPRDMIHSSEWYGRVRVMHDVYEAAAIASGSKINIGVLPNAAKILDAWFMADALGSGVTLTMGTVAAPAALIASTVCTSAVKGVMAITEITSGHGVVMVGDTLIQLTTGVGAATGTIKTTVLYTLD